ncbi:uncharacterized protein LOC123293628 [Chrysoperla carnea]|uniref:uncharacterized protein LOC123293628 n=1 Tax=Chrysoperla carnea TaxID=189513 RepID=UPI001D05F643|nr:uncharacterized protein LOC123293628 [Chrysoperla carnea]
MNTPKSKSSKLKMKRDRIFDKQVETDDEIETLAHSTPDRNNPPDSPIFFPCTQETESEVVWDWQSPQQKRVITRYKPKVTSESPALVIPFKRKVIVNSHKLNNLKERLDALNEQIINKKLHNEVPEVPRNSKKADDFENLFEDDDSFTDCLVQCSQQIEKEVLGDQQIVKTSKYSTPTKSVLNTFVNSDAKLCDDSFDMLLGTIDNEVLDTLTQQVPASKCSDTNTVIKIDLPCTENKYKIDVNNPRPLNKSDSFDEHQINCSPTTLKCTPEEIEKKRQEALAKRQKKGLSRPKSSMGINVDESPSRKFQRRNHSFEIASPNQQTKISPPQKSLEKLNETVAQEIVPIKNWEKIQQEIERKRLEALARRKKKANKV